MAFEQILQVCTWRTTLRRLVEVQRAGGSAKMRVTSMRHLRVATDRWQRRGRTCMESRRRGQASSRGINVCLRGVCIPYWRGGTSGSIVPGGQVTRTTVTCIIETMMRSGTASRRREEQPAVRAGDPLRGLVASAGSCAELIEGYIVARGRGVYTMGALPAAATSRESLLIGGLC